MGGRTWNYSVMGASASIDNEGGDDEGRGAAAERRRSIMNMQSRLSIDDIEKLCHIEKHNDPSRHMYYGQVFNTLKEWDREVRGLTCTTPVYM